MQFLILAAGKPSLGYAKEGVELYLNRLRPFGKTELKLVRDGSSQDVSKRLGGKEMQFHVHRNTVQKEEWRSLLAFLFSWPGKKKRHGFCG